MLPQSTCYQDEPGNEEDCRWNQVRAEMIFHLPAIAGIASMIAMSRTRLRFATATTPASRTNENKPDTMISPPSISSTKGTQMKNRASAIKSCTVEKRRNLKRASTGFVEGLGCVASFI